jgi:hypothetical protein
MYAARIDLRGKILELFLHRALHLARSLVAGP